MESCYFSTSGRYSTGPQADRDRLFSQQTAVCSGRLHRLSRSEDSPPVKLTSSGEEIASIFLVYGVRRKFRPGEGALVENTVFMINLKQYRPDPHITPRLMDGSDPRTDDSFLRASLDQAKRTHDATAKA